MDSYFAASQRINQATPSKVCTVCGETILWRRWLAANWEQIRYCSASCRRLSAAKARTGFSDRAKGRDHGAAESAAAA